MAARTNREATEPVPLKESFVFEEGDFHALSEGLCGDPQYNDRRLKARRKLLTLGKQGVARIQRAGPRLEARSSLHHPTQFNGNRVRRLWCYLTRSKTDKRGLKRILGAELAKDLDAAYRNAYLCVALEADGLEVSFRIHPEAWYDGQNLANRLQREGLDGWRTLLNQLDGYRLELHDWKGEWRCGQLTPERLAEFVENWVPGEHRLAVVRRFPAPPGQRGVALEPGVLEQLLDELERLVPLYRHAAWSEEASYLFSE